MRHKLFLLLVLALVWLLTGLVLVKAFSAGDYVAVIQIDGIIDSISARYISRSLDKATEDGARLMIIKLNTPGGLLSSTRDIVEDILGAKIPVAVYVFPTGAHAASAGTFITAAGNFAVMAPGTNIGAASPVASGGEDLPTTLEKKVKEDTKAFIRSIANKRNRNSQALEETVTKALAYSAEEAVEKRVADFIASDLTDLLAQLNGKTAETLTGFVTLYTQESSIKEIEITPLERFLSILAKPNIAFTLLSIGQLGILIELITPGFVGPGVVGLISLALSFIGLGHLPVNWVGIGLLLFAMILIFFELQEPGIGIFGIGGLISFVLGGFILFGDFGVPDIPKPSFRVSKWVIAVIAGIIGTFLLSFMYLVSTVRRSQIGISSSRDELIGQSGIVISDLTPSGTIRVGDELWTATTTANDVIRAGEEVIVIGAYEHILKVSKASKKS